MRAVLQEMRAKYPDRAERAKAMDAWRNSDDAKFARGTYRDVADHIDHIVKVAGVDHVGIGSDFDGISQSPVGLDDVSCYPRLTDELLRRGYSEADVHKILGGNVLRAFRQAGQVAKRLRATHPPGGRRDQAGAAGMDPIAEPSDSSPINDGLEHASSNPSRTRSVHRHA